MMTKLESRFHITVLCIAIILGFIVYWPSIHGPFIFDDFNGIKNNATLHSFDQISYLWHTQSTRFIPYFSLMINYHFSGLQTTSYHIVNIIIHIINTMLVYGLTLTLFQTPKAPRLRRTNDQNYIALFSALLFLLHPVCTEAVSYMVQRITSLTALFYLSSIFFYLQAKSKINKLYYILSLICALLAMFSKESAFTLPFILIALNYLFFAKKDKPHSRLFFRIYPYFFLTAILPLSLFVDIKYGRSLMGITKQAGAITPWEYFFTQTQVWWQYLKIVFIPFYLNADYDISVMQGLQWQVIVSLLAIALTLFLFLKKYRTSALLVFSLIWIMMTLSIESSFIALDDVMAERRLYLPLLGFIWIVVFLCYRKLSLKNFIIAGTLISIIFGTTTFIRNKVWSDENIYWSDVVKKSPYKGRGYQALGDIALRHNNFEKARDFYLTAISFDPWSYETYNVMYVAHLGANLPKRGYFYLMRSHQIYPHFTPVIKNLSIHHFELGHHAKSFKFALKYLKLNSTSESVFFYINLLNRFYTATQDEKAAYEELLKIEPFVPKDIFQSLRKMQFKTPQSP